MQMNHRTPMQMEPQDKLQVRVTPFRFHPGGMHETSPTLQLLGRPIRYVQSPEGTAEKARDWSAVPSGLRQFGNGSPMLKHWAIVACPSGTKISAFAGSRNPGGIVRGRAHPDSISRPCRYE